MLLLTFQAADNLYAIDVARVVEVVPRIQLRRLPHAPNFLAGVFDYRGKVVPVVDLGILLGSESCRDRLSTRIILVDSHPAAGSRPKELAETARIDRRGGEAKSRDEQDEPARKQPLWLLGLIAEHVSEIATVQPEQVISSSLELPQAPYLGAIVEIDHAMVQLIAVDKVMEGSLRRSFFLTEPEDSARSIATENAEAGTI